MNEKTNTDLGWRFLLNWFPDSHRSFVLKQLSLQFELNVKNFVEVGVFHGINTLFLKDLFPETHFYLIDPWEINSDYIKDEAVPVTTDANKMNNAYSFIVSQYEKNPNFTILKTKSVEGAKLVPDDLDIVFIDGNHSYDSVKEDIITWLPKVRKNGILAGHDYKDNFPGVKKAVDEIFDKNVILRGDNTWAIQITD